jgi:hypothetical protein
VAPEAGSFAWISSSTWASARAMLRLAGNVVLEQAAATLYPGGFST